MAQVRSWLKLRGSVGDTTFKRGKGKVGIVQDKLEVSKARIKYHEDYEWLRVNSGNLGKASAFSNFFRGSIAAALNYAKDNEMVQRLVEELIQLLKRDSVSVYGKAYVRPENMVHLIGFNFNQKVRLRVAFNVRYKTTITRETGKLTIDISEFKPKSAIRGPKYATHFQIVSTAVEMNYTEKSKKSVQYISENIAINSSSAGPLQIVHQLTPASTGVLFIILGLRFIDERGYYYATSEQMRAVNPLSLVDLDFIPDPVIDHPAVTENVDPVTSS